MNIQRVSRTDSVLYLMYLDHLSFLARWFCFCFCGFCLFDKAFPLLTVGGEGHTDSFGSLLESSQSSECVFGDITDISVFQSVWHLESSTCFGLWSLKSWTFRTLFRILAQWRDTWWLLSLSHQGIWQEAEVGSLIHLHFNWHDP